MCAAVMTTATTISRARKERTERARRDGSDPLRGRRRVPWRSMDIPSSGGGSDPRMRPARSHRRGRCLRYGPSRSNPLSWPSTDRSMAGMRATWPSPRRRTPSGRTSPADGRRKHLDVHSGRTVAGGCVQACRSRHPGRPGRQSAGQPLRDFHLFAARSCGRCGGFLRCNFAAQRGGALARGARRMSAGLPIRHLPEDEYQPHSESNHPGLRTHPNKGCEIEEHKKTMRVSASPLMESSLPPDAPAIPCN